MPEPILLVEDNPDDRDLTLRVLQRHYGSTDVVAVADGLEAMDFLFAEGAYANRDASVRPRLVLLDLMLPRLSGFEVLARIRADPRTRTLPVVVLTSSGERRDIEESYECGANSFVRKPVVFGEFAEAVRQLGVYWLLLNQAPTGSER